MKNNKSKKAAGAKKSSDPPFKVAPKVIRKDAGKVVKQYPAHVGYHGTGNESDLNPEE